MLECLHIGFIRTFLGWGKKERKNLRMYLFIYLLFCSLLLCSALLGGMFVIDKSKEAIWSMHNSGVRY